MTHETVDLICIQYAIVIDLVQHSVAAVDAFQLRMIWKSFAVPVASFREGCHASDTQHLQRCTRKRQEAGRWTDLQLSAISLLGT